MGDDGARFRLKNVSALVQQQQQPFPFTQAYAPVVAPCGPVLQHHLSVPTSLHRARTCLLCLLMPSLRGQTPSPFPDRDRSRSHRSSSLTPLLVFTLYCIFNGHDGRNFR